MKSIAAFFAWFGKVFSLLGLCATVGFIAGGLAGGTLMLYAVNAGATPMLTGTEVWQVSLLLWAFTSLVLLFYLYVFCRYTFGSILLPVLFNCVLTCFLTTWVVNHFGTWGWAFFVGAAIGLLVGRLLCMCCYHFTAKPYGLYSTSTEMRVGE